MAKRLGLLVVLVALVGGCGEEGECEDEGACAAPAKTELSRCPASDTGQNAGDWGGSVSGISCNDAGQFIFRHGIRDFPQPPHTSTRATIKRSEPGTFESDGFNCRYQPLSGRGGWHIRCAQTDKLIAFNFTP